MNNILFIIPHPDDEIVGASIIINIKKKKKLFFFFLRMESFLKINNGIGIEMGTKRK